MGRKYRNTEEIRESIRKTLMENGQLPISDVARKCNASNNMIKKHLVSMEDISFEKGKTDYNQPCVFVSLILL